MIDHNIYKVKPIFNLGSLMDASVATEQKYALVINSKD